MAVLSANGVALRYEVTGAGPPLCLIIGYRLHGAAWPDVFVESLAQRFSVLTFDNRGTGLSDKPADDYGIPTMAADVIGLLDGLGWARAHVLGFSIGGAIAQELAIRHPERVNRLVLFATFPGWGQRHSGCQSCVRQSSRGRFGPAALVLRGRGGSVRAAL